MGYNINTIENKYHIDKSVIHIIMKYIVTCICRYIYIYIYIYISKYTYIYIDIYRYQL